MTTDLTLKELDEWERWLCDDEHSADNRLSQDGFRELIAAARKGIEFTRVPAPPAQSVARLPNAEYMFGVDKPTPTHGSEAAMRDPLSSPYSPQGPTGDWTNEPPDWRDAKTEEECNKRLFAADSLKERLVWLMSVGLTPDWFWTCSQRDRQAEVLVGAATALREALARIEGLEWLLNSEFANTECLVARIATLEAENKRRVEELDDWQVKAAQRLSTIATLRNALLDIADPSCLKTSERCRAIASSALSDIKVKG